MPSRAFWNDPDIVDRFAEKDPDERLRTLIEEYDQPELVRVLDLGCAGGRNTELLAREGFDVHAVDASEAMVERTKRRIANVLGRGDGDLRVRQMEMTDLGRFPGETFDLVLALGIYHNAASWKEWNQAVGETARVTAPGGRLLYAGFAPGTDLTGEGTRPVPEEPHLFEGFPSGKAVLLSAEELEENLARFEFEPTVSTETVTVEMEDGRRVTVNGLFEKRPAGDQ